ncbi:MAG TPA: Asp-tRNA(Asn)/Glu-tRNA(Gln) amidotransferase subunit GatC [Candidatus Dormibacteraeota bacterium]|nr:Asp-tRNA(Asn)/Glu-tRNA(Gln) amidotransferase subunit GatC [Candidatus Dormibacteraeota bacterium]
MAITRAEVRHIALLARMPLSEDEEIAFAQQLDHILEAFTNLDRLDTDAVEPTAHVAPMATPFRDDVVSTTPDTDAWLANSPARDGRFFKVPKIIE